MALIIIYDDEDIFLLYLKEYFSSWITIKCKQPRYKVDNGDAFLSCRSDHYNQIAINEADNAV